MAGDERAAPTLDVVTFFRDGHRFGVEARLVRGQSVPSGSGETLLRIGDRLVAVTPPVELRRFAAASIHPPPPLVAARCRPPVPRGLAFDEAGLVLLVDGDHGFDEALA